MPDLHISLGTGSGSGSGGDDVSVNTSAATDANLSDTTPAAPADGVNVRWQKDTSAPDNISANLRFAASAQAGAVSAAAQTLSGKKTLPDGASTAHLDLTETTTATPGADTMRLQALDRNGFTFVEAHDSTGFVQQLMRDNITLVRNTSGGTIVKGSLVTVNGSTGQIPNVQLADADDPNLQAKGMVVADIGNNNFGRIMTLGRLSGLNTDGIPEGTQLYLSQTPGEYTTTAPTHPAIRQFIGEVSNEHLTQGIIAVDIGVPLGDFTGTRQDIFRIGDNAAGTKTLRFRNGNDLDLVATPTAARTVTLPDATVSLAAHAGDIAGGTAAAPALPNNTVTYAKMQDVSAASRLVGRGDSGSGDPQEIVLGTNLTMSGTTLNASGGGAGDSDQTVLGVQVFS